MCMPNRRYYAGVDCGSRTTKLVLWDAATGEVAHCALTATGVRPDATAEPLLAEAPVPREHIAGVVSTGYGRHIVNFADRAVSEITCHARGVFHLDPTARTVIDIGGQDAKAICLAGDGRVLDFAMNDRCAAGTGRFLEVLAHLLETTVDRLDELSAQSTAPAAISATCVVFAESEIIGLLAQGASPAAIADGVHRAVAERVAGMTAGLTMQAPVVFTGGVAANDGVRRRLELALGLPVRAAPWQPVLTGALGAALLAAERRE